MEIICDKCRGKFKISDGKIPAGKTISLRCPRCGAKISVKYEQKKDIGGQVSDNMGIHCKEESDLSEKRGSDFYDKPFDFLEEEEKTALVCESDPDVLKKVINVLSVMEYHITQSSDTRDALKRMRYHTYDLVILNENFDTKNPDSNDLLIYISRLGMFVRRMIYVCLISSRFRTMDNMMAFCKSVNIIINIKNIDSFDVILGRGITDRDMFYKVYLESVRKLDRL